MIKAHSFSMLRIQSELVMPHTPTIEELLTLSRKRDQSQQKKRISFDHGIVTFGARKDDKRISIEVDSYGTRNILPHVQSELADRHFRYLDEHHDIKRGGAATAFGKTGFHCHVAPEHADEWLQMLFDVVADEANLEPAMSMEEAMRKSLEEVRKTSA